MDELLVAAIPQREVGQDAPFNVPSASLQLKKRRICLAS